MIELLAVVLLAQAQTGWILFEVCQLDFSTQPPVASRQRDHDTFYIRPGHIHVISDIMPHPTGIKCVQVASNSGYKVYVIGTVKSVQKKLAEFD